MDNQKQKPLVLFLDAATPLFYIAIKHMETGLLAQRHYNHTELKGEALMWEVKSILEKNSHTVNEIAYLCTTKGPGSLTGLRISMSLLKTMGQILKIPIVCIPTLYALERSYVSGLESDELDMMTCLTARKNSFYVRFSGNKEDDFKQFSTETFCEKAKDVNILLWPSGSVPLDVCDKRQVNSVIVRLSPELIFDLCAFKYQNKEYVDYIECQQEYAGKSVAEKNFEKK